MQWLDRPSPVRCDRCAASVFVQKGMCGHKSRRPANDERYFCDRASRYSMRMLSLFDRAYWFDGKMFQPRMSFAEEQDLPRRDLEALQVILGEKLQTLRASLKRQQDQAHKEWRPRDNR